VGVVLMHDPTASAQVFLEQGKVNLTVQPGETVTGEITINNTGNKELGVKMYWEDFVYQPPFDGNKKFMPAGTAPSSLSRWVQFSPRNAVLPSFAKKKIGYTIQVPADAKGGYYGVLFIEPENEDLNSDKGVKIITRVGCLFFVETDDKIKQASLDDIAISGSQLTGKFTNKGNVILLPQSTYYVMDRESIIADRGELKAQYIPPSESSDIDVPFNDSFLPGDYTLVLTFDLQDGDVVVKEVDFTKNSDSDFSLKTVRD